MIELLSLYKFVRVVLLPLAAALLGIWLGHIYNAHQQKIGEERERVRCDQRANQLEHEARKQEINWITELNHAQSKAQKSREQAFSAQRSAADAGRLFSSTLAAGRERAHLDTPSACPQYTNTVTAILDECQAAYREMAGHADGHAADALMLQQAWPK